MLFAHNLLVDAITFMVISGLMEPAALPPLAPSFALPDPVPQPGISPLAAEAEHLARINAHDLAGMAELYHRDAQVSYAALGMAPLDRAAFIALNEAYVQAFPDLHFELIRRVDMGDGWVLFEGVSRGTHQDSYFGIPATGNSIKLRLAWINRRDADGLVREGYVYHDGLTILVQIGAIPAP